MTESEETLGRLSYVERSLASAREDIAALSKAVENVADAIAKVHDRLVLVEKNWE